MGEVVSRQWIWLLRHTYHRQMKKLIRNIKNAVWYDEVQIQVRDATSNSEETVTIEQLSALRLTANDPQKYPALFSMLWKRITHYKHHRHIEKALYVLIYLVRLKPPSADVQRRLIDDILQPSQFTDLRLLANLRPRADFPVLAKIRSQANDLLDWLLQMRNLDRNKLTPIPDGGFDLPEPRGEGDDEDKGSLATQLQQQQPQSFPPNQDIFDLLAESLNEQQNYNGGYSNNNNNNNNNNASSFDAFDPFAILTGETPAYDSDFNKSHEPVDDMNKKRATKKCTFCDHDNDLDAVVCENCGCEFGGAIDTFDWDGNDNTNANNHNDGHDHGHGDGHDHLHGLGHGQGQGHGGLGDNQGDNWSTCAKCGTRNPPGSRFCSGCGSPLDAHGDHIHQYQECTHCHFSQNPMDATHCLQCGHSLRNASQHEVRGWACAWCSHLNDVERVKCLHCQKDKQASERANGVKYQMSSQKHTNKNNEAGEQPIWQCTCFCINENGAYYCRICGLDYSNRLRANIADDAQTGVGHGVRTQERFHSKKEQALRQQQQQADPNYGTVRLAMPGLTNGGQAVGAAAAATAASQQQPQQQQQRPISSLSQASATGTKQPAPTPAPAPVSAALAEDDDPFAALVNFNSAPAQQQQSQKPAQQQQQQTKTSVSSEPFDIFTSLGGVTAASNTSQPARAASQPNGDAVSFDIFSPTASQPATAPVPSRPSSVASPQLSFAPSSPNTDLELKRRQQEDEVRQMEEEFAQKKAALRRQQEELLRQEEEQINAMKRQPQQQQQQQQQPPIPQRRPVPVPTQPPAPESPRAVSVAAETPSPVADDFFDIWANNALDSKPVTTTSVPVMVPPTSAASSVTNNSVVSVGQSNPRTLVRPDTAVGGASDFLSSMDQNMSYRRKVRGEIIATESSYIDQLTVLRDCFIEPLKNSAVSMKVPIEAVSTLLTDVDPLLNLHRNFRISLGKTKEDSTGLAALFITSAPLMTVYKDYVANYQKTLNMIDYLTEENKSFKAFIERCTSDPRFAGRSLLSFYIAPVQRLPRYVLLLKELKSAYEKTITQAQEVMQHPEALFNTHDEDLIALSMNSNLINEMENECTIIQEAIEVINAKAIEVNEYQKQVEGCARLEAVYTKLGKKHNALQIVTTVQNHRRLIREDQFKQERNGKLRDVTSIMCNDAIFFTNHETTEFKGGINFIHLVYRSSLDYVPRHNDLWQLNFENLPMPAATTEHFIDLRCHDLCYEHPHGVVDLSKTPKNSTNGGSTFYHATLSKDVLMPPTARPTSGSVSQPQLTEHPSDRDPTDSQFTQHVLSHLAIDKSHVVTFFRLVFPSRPALENYVQMLEKNINDTIEISTNGYFRHQAQQQRAATTAAAASRPKLSISLAPTTLHSSSNAPAPVTSLMSPSGMLAPPNRLPSAPAVPSSPVPIATASLPTPAQQHVNPFDIPQTASHQSSPQQEFTFDNMTAAAPNVALVPSSAVPTSANADGPATSAGGARPAAQSARRQSTLNPLAYNPTSVPTFVFKAPPQKVDITQPPTANPVSRPPSSASQSQPTQRQPSANSRPISPASPIAPPVAAPVAPVAPVAPISPPAQLPTLPPSQLPVPPPQQPHQPNPFVAAAPNPFDDAPAPPVAAPAPAPVPAVAVVPKTTLPQGSVPQPPLMLPGAGAGGRLIMPTRSAQNLPTTTPSVNPFARPTG